jgi:uncharacterized FAD-dependent dehydrogenase
VSTTLNITCSPAEAAQEGWLQKQVALRLKADVGAVHYRIIKKSVDARGRNIKINLDLEVAQNQPLAPRGLTTFNYQNVANQKRVLIVGAGPAGMWAALRCLELGLKPIILERGKNVRSRRRDLKAITRDNIVNPNSNYCFGEGGAGTYSDGKLYTRSKKRGSVKRILDSLVQHGAIEDILFEAQPHIGTNKLPKIVQALRETILKFGGEVHFNTQVTNILQKDQKIIGLETAEGKVFKGEATILATGHSARDIFELLHTQGIALEAKPFAMGVRVEHKQALINKIQYHGNQHDDYLPAASYKLVQQVSQRGVYSFCMCPGGYIVPAATAQNELVVNGMSPSKRDNKFANSGIVVSVEEEDLKPYAHHGPLAGLAYQKAVEKLVWEAGGKTQKAAAQRMIDFVKGRTSPQEDLNETSYTPGLVSAPLHHVLPKPLAVRLQQAFIEFGKKMKGYYTNEANLIGIESRTSSPVRIPRNKETLQHPQFANFFPCGEGAGYAGGIVSAAMDGEACADAVAKGLGVLIEDF